MIISRGALTIKVLIQDLFSFFISHPCSDVSPVWRCLLSQNGLKVAASHFMCKWFLCSVSTLVGSTVKHSGTVVQPSLLLAAVSAESKLFVRFDIWEQGNVSSLQLSDRLQGALRHALCDVLMELKVLPNPLCVLGMRPATKTQADEVKGEFMS